MSRGKCPFLGGGGQCPFRGVVVLSTEIHDRCSLFTLSSVAVRVLFTLYLVDDCTKFINS